MSNKFNHDEWKKRDKKLRALVKTLNPETSWEELENLEKIHKGIIIKYWRTYFKTTSKFIDFMNNMEDRFPEQYWPDEDEAVSGDISPEEVIEIADRLTIVPALDVDAMIANIVKDNP